MAAGITAVKLDVLTADITTATLVNGEKTKLATGPGGSQILWRDEPPGGYGYENEWPEWFDDEKREHVRAELFRKLEDALAARPIVVNSFLDLRGSDMTTLPQLYVRDSMNIEHSQIAELAPGTRVVGSLYAAGSKLTRLPEDLTIGCNPDDPTNGSLMIEGLPITELPESLTVGGLIRAAGSHLTWNGIPEPLWPSVRGLGRRDRRRCSPRSGRWSR